MTEFDKAILNVINKECTRNELTKALYDIKIMYLKMASMLRYASPLKDEYQYMARHVGTMAGRINALPIHVGALCLDDITPKTTCREELIDILFEQCARIEELTDEEAKYAWLQRK